MNYFQAERIAKSCVHDLAPYCERIEIAGSIRRHKPDVHDIEVVCIPKRITPKRTANAFCAAVLKMGRILEGKPTEKNVKVRLIPDWITLDLFMVTSDNWGYQFAIRTGSADYSHTVLASGWVKAGYKGIDGMLTKDGVPIPVREEWDLFELIGIPFEDPIRREV